MARPNYGFQKRQKELAKQQKREAKAQRKRERAAGQEEEVSPPDLPADTTPSDHEPE